MKDVVTILLVLLVVATDVTLWIRNPMHVPAGFAPARAFGFQVFRESDSSMTPTISPGQHVVVSTWAYWKHEPQVGDLIVFQYPRNPSLADLKRIVAAGGSTVEIRNGILYIDGKRGPESHSRRYVKLMNGGHNMLATRVPPGSYFVMGDDADSSEDSRDYGVIPRDRIIGEAIWPAKSADHSRFEIM